MIDAITNQHFTNPGDERNPSASVGGLATDCTFSFLRSGSSMVRDDDQEMSRSPGRSAQFDRQISFHEAGHVVASRLLGLSIAGATINFVYGHHGLTWASDAALQPDAESVDDLVDQLSTLMPGIGEDRASIAVELQRAGDQVIALLAGPLAEELFCSEPLPGTGHDQIEARAVASLVVRSPRSVDAYIDFAQAEARALLLAHRDVVLAVADGLIRYRTINGEQITTLIANAQHNEIERK